jgi:hypothetical protein
VICIRNRSHAPQIVSMISGAAGVFPDFIAASVVRVPVV